MIATSVFEGFDLWEDRPTGIACTNDTINETGSEEEISFEDDHMLCIQIKMDDSDFETMRNESRFGPPIQEGTTVTAVLLEYLNQCDVPWPSEFNWYKGEVVIDGVVTNEIGIRKKGFFGSIFSTAPSIKINTDQYIANQTIGKTRKITLNNNAEDASRIRTCLNFKVFELANYPAPRCNLSNVAINDEPLGVYTHLEAVSDPFLQRAFGNNTGDLYEGQLVDFREEWLPRWAAKTENTDAVGTPLLGIANALEMSDDEFLTEVEKHLNLDNYITFWAIEVLLDHVDGYASNRNNFYVYFDPNDDNRATFIPWGLNYFSEGLGSKLQGEDAAEFTSPLQGFLNAELPRRLSRIPSITTKFENELTRLLQEVWDEPTLLNLVDNYAIQIQTAQIDNNYNATITQLKQWIENRRETLEELIELGLPQGNENPSKNCSN